MANYFVHYKNETTLGKSNLISTLTHSLIYPFVHREKKHEKMSYAESFPLHNSNLLVINFTLKLHYHDCSLDDQSEPCVADHIWPSILSAVRTIHPITAIKKTKTFPHMMAEILENATYIKNQKAKTDKTGKVRVPDPSSTSSIDNS